MHLAAFGGHVSLVAELVDTHNASVHRTSKVYTATMCMLWVSAIVKSLAHCLQHGRTAVHYGAMEGHKEVVELLIDKYNLSAMQKDNVSCICIVCVM